MTKPLYYDVWIEQHASQYMEKLGNRLHNGEYSFEKYSRLSDTLLAWEEQYIQKFGQPCKDKNFLKK